jgi:photosystem II stability/assembly factor-like uncharacterized protein
MRTRWLCSFALCFVVQAAEVSPALFSGLKWRLAGPFRGGRAVAVSGVPGGGATFYFGAVDGGVWKTEDAGTVWTPIFDAQSVASIGALEAAPSDPNTIYVGTGESDIRSDLATGDGIYKSIDGGRTWKNIGLRDTRQISRIVVNPHDANLVFVGALGHAYGPNGERGVFRSKDGGATWQKVLDRGPNVGVADLAIAPDEPAVLIAAMWEAHRPPWSTYAPIAGPGSGLFRSSDGGDTWQQLRGHGLPGGDWGRVSIAIARGAHGKRIYATIDAKPASGLYRSDDGGDNWALVNKDPRITSRAWYFSSITADPNDPDVVYVPNVAFLKLSDGGKSLSIVRGAPGGDDYHQVWIDPANSQHMALGTDQGTTVTLDGGATWSSWYNQPTAQFYHVITDTRFPYNIYGPQQDTGTAAIPSQTDHGEIDMRDWFTVSGSESGYIAPDPGDPNIFYVSGAYGAVLRFDRRLMQSQNVAPWPVSEFGTEMLQRKYRDPWTPVLVFSPLAPHPLFLGNQYVMKTLDGGLHWQAISPDLTGAAKMAPSGAAEPLSVGNAKQRGYGVVYTIAPSPLSAAEIWAGSDTGLIHLTRDGGKTWPEVTPQGLSPWSKITHIEASHFRAGEAYAAVDRHRLDDMRPYLYRTRDFGKSWDAITQGIADNAFLNAIREDPKHKGLLFAGTEFGVYVSFNDGDNWSPLKLNLPVTSVRDLVIHDNDLVIATHGRAFWVLDDIEPLRQIADNANADAVRLYRPERAVRINNEAFWGTPLPPEEPQAPNPPRGAYLDYYLPTGSAREVTLEISDNGGHTIQRFSSRDKPATPAEYLPVAPRWLPKPQALSEEAGMHRFVWDLHYGPTGANSAEDFEDEGNAQWEGPLAMPGRYTVKLTVAGQTLTQPLDVAMDPRSGATRAELLAQFDWAQRAFKDLVLARRTAAQLEAVQAQLAANAEGKSTAIAESSKTVGMRAGEILAGKDQATGAGLQATVRSLTAAFNALESADRTPPSQVITLYNESHKTLTARLADWEALRRGLLASLNQQLRDAGLPPVRIEHE